MLVIPVDLASLHSYSGHHWRSVSPKSASCCLDLTPEVAPLLVSPFLTWSLRHTHSRCRIPSCAVCLGDLELLKVSLTWVPLTPWRHCCGVSLGDMWIASPWGCLPPSGGVWQPQLHWRAQSPHLCLLRLPACWENSRETSSSCLSCPYFWFCF